jgi:hypothetical protein
VLIDLAKAKRRWTEKNNSKGCADGSKGSEKGSAGGKVDSNIFSGHWQKDCYKKKADMQVRQVE